MKFHSFKFHFFIVVFIAIFQQFANVSRANVFTDGERITQFEVLSRERRKSAGKSTNEEPGVYLMVENYAKCCQSAVITPSKKNGCYRNCHEAMETNSIKSTCKNQDGLSYCLTTLKSAYKACTKTKYPSDTPKCQSACQSFLDGLVTENTEQLRKTLEIITECLEATGNELSTILEDLQYHKGTEYLGCCDEISGRNYHTWTCSLKKCQGFLSTLDVRLSYENMRQECIDPKKGASAFIKSDEEEAMLHLKSCLKVKELNQSPRQGQVPLDASLNLTMTLPRINGFGHYCCQFVPSNEISCRNQCEKIFDKPGSTTASGAQLLAETFDLQCGQKIGMQRASSCVQNVIAGQCRPGCSRMNFCSSFNNKPSVTFRRCTDMADQAASLLYQQWTRRNELAFDHLESSSDLSEPDLSNKYLNPSDVGSPRIPLKDISNCEPLVFKAVACALTIKPCSKTQTSRICLQDCVRLLSNCGNFSRGPYGAQEEARKRCVLLLGGDGGDCVSIYELSETSRSGEASMTSSAVAVSPSKSLASLKKNEVTYPCSSSNLCRDSNKEVCEISRQGVQNIPGEFELSSLPNKCTRGCSMQDWSTVHMMSLPDEIVIGSMNGNASHCIVCRCMAHIDQDKTAFFCDVNPQKLLENKCNFHVEKKCPSETQTRSIGSQSNPSSLFQGSSYHSGTTTESTDYIIECNFCSCLNGKTYCTKRLCLTDYTLDNEKKNYGIEFTGLPKNADDEYIATCASNGRTYPNDQVAEALGLSNYQLGVCEETIACYSSMCPLGYQCVTTREVCLTKNYDCYRHRCVKDNQCLQHVCDEFGETHANKCHQDLPKYGGWVVDIAYPGRCDEKCPRLQVCGTNGHTYPSPCAAFHDRVLVDYPGKCRDFAVQITDTEPRKCYKISDSCPVLPDFCRGVHAFGVCCPICGAVARLIPAPELVDMVHLTLVGSDPTNPADQYTVRDVVMAVRQYITLPQCDVFGHLSMDDSVTLLFTVPFNDPTPLQVQACTEEAKRIVSLFIRRDVTLISNVHLFPIAGADVEASFVKFTSSSCNIFTSHFVHAFILVLSSLFTQHFLLPVAAITTGLLER